MNVSEDEIIQKESIQVYTSLLFWSLPIRQLILSFIFIVGDETF